jgi:fumarate reductase flavoprotein subunit
VSRQVVIVGGGNAGLAAAVTAGELGLDTLVIEKMDRLGGQLHWSSGHFSAAGTRLQASRGIADTPRAHADDVMRLGHGLGTPHLIELATARAGPTVDWLEELGFPFSPESPAFVTGHELYSAPRTYWGGTDPRAGGAPIMETLLTALEHLESVAVVFRRSLVDLLMDGDTCRGVLLDDGTAAEADLTILATGGYAADRSLVGELQAPFGDALTGCLPHATGDGLRVLLRYGAELVAADTYVPTMGMIPDPRHQGYGIPLHEARLIVNANDRPPWEIWVDPTGRRFVDESTRSPFAREQALLKCPSLAMAAVWDETIFQEAPPVIGPDWTKDRMRAAAEKNEWLHRCQSLADLAGRLGVDPGGLATTVEEWNEADGDPFGRTHRPLPIVRPPFWGVRSVGGMLLSRGGPRVDENLQPLLNGTPAQGLRCVGELLGMGQFSGDSFAGGMSVGPALSLGRWAVLAGHGGRAPRGERGSDDRHGKPAVGGPIVVRPDPGTGGGDIHEW